MELRPCVGVVVLNYGRPADTIACIESVLRSTYPSYKLVVVDNKSPDDSVPILHEFLRGESVKKFESATTEYCFHRSQREKYELEDGIGNFGRLQRPFLSLIASEENKGYASGNNIGISYLAADPSIEYFWILNNDTEVDNYAMRELVLTLEQDDSIGMCGSTVVYDFDRYTVQAQGGAVLNRRNADVHLLGHLRKTDDLLPAETIQPQLDLILGASVMVTSLFVDEVGLMNEEYFMYFEEVDWAIRRNKQLKLAYAPRSIVYHKEGATIGGGSGSNVFTARQAYYLARNKLKFARRFLPNAKLGVIASLTLTAISRLRRGELRNASIIILFILGFRDKSRTLSEG